MGLSRASRQYLGVRALLPPDLQYALRNPTSSDKAYVKGTLWLNTASATAFMWPGTGDWISLGSGTTGAIVTLTGNTGGAISPVGGNISILGGSGVTVTGSAGTLTIALTGGGIAMDSFVPDAGTNPVVPSSLGVVTMAGTANQITTTGGLNTLTFSLPSAITAPGSLTTTTGLTAGSGFTVSAGAVTVTSGTSAINISADAAATTINIGTGAAVKGLTLGSTNTTSATTIQSGSAGITMTGAITASSNLTLNGAATKLSVHGGAVTDFIGTGTLTAGTQTIANTNIAATDRIFISRISKSTSTALGVFSYSISAATSFTVTSLNPTDGSTETNDVSTYAYFIVRQA